MEQQQTLIAAYEDSDRARRALDALLGEGFSREQARLGTSESLGTSTTGTESTRSSYSESDHHTLMEKIAHFFGMDDDDDTTATYSEAMRRGNSVVAVDAETDDEAQRAADILGRFDPIDIDSRVSEWEASGWQRPGMNLESNRRDERAEFRGDSGEITEQARLPVVEEQIQVGTRVVSSGGVRVVSRTREIPVEESVQLREERATVTRRPVDRPLSEADRPFEEKTLEVRESREEPVVGKTARVVEEVVVGKETRRREEKVRDSVRKTEVEVQQVAELSEAERLKRQRE